MPRKCRSSQLDLLHEHSNSDYLRASRTRPKIVPQDDVKDDETDCDISPEDDQNIIVSVNSLREFICKNFTCKRCRKKPQESNFCFSHLGLATKIDFGCAGSCKQTEEIALLPKERTNDARKAHPSNPGNIDFSINVGFVLACQSIGIGQTKATRFAGILGLTHHGKLLGNTWPHIEQEISQKEIQLSEGIMKQNVDTEESEEGSKRMQESSEAKVMVDFPCKTSDHED